MRSSKRTRHLLMGGRNRGIIIGLALLVALLVAGGLTIEGFLSTNNFRSILLLAAFLGLASLGQTLVALLGGIDLSIPFVIGAANVALPSLFNLGVPPLLAMAIVLVAGGLIGALNGVLSFRLQGQVLVLTLGMGFAVVGGIQILTSQGSAFGGNVFATVPPWLTNIASMGGTTFGIRMPPLVFIWAVAALVVILTLSRSRLGRSLYALGGNRTAAALVRISEFRLWTLAYTVSGASAALTGMMLLGFSGGGFVDIGDPYLFTTVAAVVIGGTSLLGGWGGYGATVIGVLVLTVLGSLLVGLGLEYAAQQAIFGLMIIPLVALYARTPHIRMQI